MFSYRQAKGQPILEQKHRNRIKEMNLMESNVQSISYEMP